MPLLVTGLFVITISRGGNIDRYLDSFIAAVFMPDINFGYSRVTRLAFGAAGSGRSAFFNFTFTNPYLKHAAHSIGIGVKVQGDVTERALAPLFDIVTDI